MGKKKQDPKLPWLVNYTNKMRVYTDLYTQMIATLNVAQEAEGKKYDIRDAGVMDDMAHTLADSWVDVIITDTVLVPDNMMNRLEFLNTDPAYVVDITQDEELDVLRQQIFDDMPNTKAAKLSGRPLSLAFTEGILANCRLVDTVINDMKYTSGSWRKNVIADDDCTTVFGFDLHKCSEPGIDYMTGKAFSGVSLWVYPLLLGPSKQLVFCATLLGSQSIFQDQHTLFVVDDDGNLDIGESKRLYKQFKVNTLLSFNSIPRYYSNSQFSEELAQMAHNIVYNCFAIEHVADEHFAKMDNLLSQSLDSLSKGDKEEKHEYIRQIMSLNDDYRQLFEIFVTATAEDFGYVSKNQLNDVIQQLLGEQEDLKTAYQKELAELKEYYEHSAKLANDRIAEFEARDANEEKELRRLNKENSDLRESLAAAQDEVSALAESRSVVDTMTLPRNTYDALTLASHLWADRLVITEDAIKSAKDFTNGDVNEVFAHLQALATVMWNLIFVENSNNPQKDFTDRTGVECTFKTTNRVKTTQFANEYSTMYNGKREMMFSHTKGKNPAVNYAFRCHFFFDHDAKRIVIGHCGDHLRTTLTPRLT